MQLDRLHKNRVGMTEILELAVNFVGPLHTVKEIVPKAIHYDQQRSRDLSKARRVVFQNSLHQIRLVGSPEAKLIKVVGKVAVRTIPVLKVSKFGIE